MDSTNEFSFIIKPAQHGVGVFAAHDISKGAHLRLFGDDKVFEHRARILNEKEIPEKFKGYCMSRGEDMVCPPDFGAMPIGWHLNHSIEANAEKGPNNNPQRKYQWYASRDIKEGEEILINYNSLEEPEEQKREYYKNL
jgi:SET domain-containing protein